MRRGMAISAACVLALVLAAPVAAGPNVSNTSGGFTGAEGDWSTYDEATGAYTYGYLFAHLDAGQKTATVDFGQFSGDKVQCTGQDTPDDPSDDSYGAIGDSLYGSGPASSFKVPKDFSLATATATIDLYHDSYNDCTGEYVSDFLGGINVRLDLTANGPLATFKDRTSFHVKGGTSGHSSIVQTTRSATGSVTIDGVVSAVDFGIIGSVSWKDHSKG